MAEVKNPQDSPALREQAADYPAEWQGKVPLRVRVTQFVRSDFPFAPAVCCHKDGEYSVWVNSYGAVAALLPGGESLGLKPDEFEVTLWHVFAGVS